MTKVVHVSGKRRKAIARVTVKPGKGVIRINSMLLEQYNPELSRMRIMEPLYITVVSINTIRNGR